MANLGRTFFSFFLFFLSFLSFFLFFCLVGSGLTVRSERQFRHSLHSKKMGSGVSVVVAVDVTASAH